MSNLVIRLQLALAFVMVFTDVMNAQKNRSTPLVVFITGDHEYSSEESMPFIADIISKDYGMEVKVLKAWPDENAEENIPGLEILERADLAIFFLRWRRLPEDQVNYIEKYLQSGKPIIGFRTSTHAFNYPVGHPLEKWNAFGERALGAPPGWGGKANHTHCGHSCSTDVSIVDSAKAHPILAGITEPFHVRSWLYNVVPDYPPAGATILLLGKAINSETEKFPDNPVAWTWKTESDAKVFTTTMGHPEDFQVEPFQRLIINAIHWSLNKPVPAKWKGKYPVNISYHGIK